MARIPAVRGQAYEFANCLTMYLNSSILYLRGYKIKKDGKDRYKTMQNLGYNA